MTEIIVALVSGLAAIVVAFVNKIAPGLLEARRQRRNELRKAPPAVGPVPSPRASSPPTGRPAEPPGKLGREEVVDLLDRYHQRATYGAVAGVVGGIARSVMSGLPRSPRYSWVVKNEWPFHPSGYSASEMHLELEERAHVITTAEKLWPWLRDPR